MTFVTRHYWLATAFAGLLAVSAFPALAQCPSASNLEKGVSLIRYKPLVRLDFARQANGLLIELRQAMRDGAIELIQAEYSHPLTVVRRTDGASVLTLEYAKSQGQLRKLPETRSWSSKIVLSLADGRRINGSISIRYRGRVRERIGNCSYEAWEVSEIMTLPGKPDTLFTKFYAPDVGLVTRVVRQNPDGSHRSEVRVDTIKALK